MFEGISDMSIIAALLCFILMAVLHAGRETPEERREREKRWREEAERH